MCKNGVSKLSKYWKDKGKAVSSLTTDQVDKHNFQNFTNNNVLAVMRRSIKSNQYLTDPLHHKKV